MKSTMMARLIQHTGASDTFAEHAFQQDIEVVAALDKFARQHNGISTAPPDGLRTTCVDCGTEAASIGALKSGWTGGGTAGIGGGPEVVVQAPAHTSIDETIADRSQLVAVVKRHRGALKYCYDQQLKGDASVGGRLEVAWYIQSGRATDLFVVANSTGSRELADCVMGKIERWRFPDAIEGDVSWPFIFRAAD